MDRQPCYAAGQRFEKSSEEIRDARYTLHATVARFLQSLGAVSVYLEKGLAHCEDNNIDLNEIVETRLYPDMLPFRFQLIQVASHSIGAVSGALAGEYAGPAAEDLDYRALQDLIMMRKPACSK